MLTRGWPNAHPPCDVRGLDTLCVFEHLGALAVRHLRCVRRTLQRFTIFGAEISRGAHVRKSDDITELTNCDGKLMVQPR